MCMKTKSFWRLLSAATAAAVLASAAAVSVAADDSLRVSPVEGTIVANNATAVYAEEAVPFDNSLKASRITLNAGMDPIDHSPAVWGGWDDRAQLFMKDDSAPLTGSTGLVFYVDLPSANSFCISPNINNATDMTVKVGASYQVRSVDGGAWETRTAGKGILSNATLWGSMTFDTAFKGWVYLPWDSLGVDTDFVLNVASDTMARITLCPQKVGGNAGSLTFGPLYLAVSSGGEALPTLPAESTTETPAESTTETPGESTTETPAETTTEAPASGTGIQNGVLAGLQVSAIDFPVMNNSTTVAGIEVKPLGDAYPKGVQITMQDGKEPVDSEWTLDRGWEPRAQLGEGWAALTDSENLVFYISLPAANKLAFSMYAMGDNDAGNFQMKVGSTYKVMAEDASEWTERTAGQGQKDNTTGWGCMEFDSAFTGWVSIPWSSLYGEMDNGDPLDLKLGEHNLVRACVIAQKLGGNTGTNAVTFGPLFTAKAAASSGTTGGNTPTTTKTANVPTGETGSVAGVVLLCAVSLGAVLTVKKAKKRG